MSLSHSPSIVTSGLVLCLDAANVKSYPGSGTAWNDLSGVGNHGTLVNGPTYSSANNGSIVFDGVNDIVNKAAPTLVTGNSDFTKEVWLYSNYKGSSTSHPNILSWGNNSANNKNGLALQTDAGGNAQILHWFYANDYVWSITDITGSWNSIVITYTAATLTLYINGVNNGTKSVTGTPNVASTNLEIGFYSTFNYAFNGNISNIKVYNRALTATEVQQNFNALRGRYGI